MKQVTIYTNMVCVQEIPDPGLGSNFEIWSSRERNFRWKLDDNQQ